MSKNDTHEPQNDTQKLNKKKTSKRSHVSSNRSVIPELAEGSPADNKIPLPRPQRGRTKPPKYTHPQNAKINIHSRHRQFRWRSNPLHHLHPNENLVQHILTMGNTHSQPLRLFPYRDNLCPIRQARQHLHAIIPPTHHRLLRRLHHLLHLCQRRPTNAPKRQYQRIHHLHPPQPHRRPCTRCPRILDNKII